MSPNPHRILIVDDQAASLAMLAEFVAETGNLSEAASDGYEALLKARLGIDLVLLDAKMPGMDGFEVARRLREDPETAEIPILMVTVLSGRREKVRALEAGVNDFIEKPIDPTELRIRVTSLLAMKCAQDELREQHARLEELVDQRTAALRSALDRIAEAQRAAYGAQLETIQRLALAAEVNDANTAAHIRRVSEYCAILGRRLGLAPGDVETLSHASALHDVGKIGVPHPVLRKTGKLDSREWELMKQHTVLGARLLSGSPSPLLQAGETIALSHHERWDGTGYPRGLVGETIPLWGRICALADVFDALTSERPYKEAFSLEMTRQIIQQGRGRHFDPALTELFLCEFDEMAAIQAKFRDQRPALVEALPGTPLQTAAPADAPTVTRARRLIVADENVEAADLLCDILSMWGHDVRSPMDGREAIELAARFQPDVVVLGLRLAKLDGCSVARELRSRPETRETFLVAMTEFQQEEDRRTLWDAGFNHQLAKPVDLGELQRLLAALQARDLLTRTTCELPA